MSKPFKTYDEQIEILSNRDLDINNPEYTKIILSQVNYYNLINGYKTGSSFEKIYALHEMNLELKEVVFFFSTPF